MIINNNPTPVRQDISSLGGAWGGFFLTIVRGVMLPTKCR